MANATAKRLSRFDLMAARSLFCSLFQEGWDQRYITWQEAITMGSLEWSSTASKLREIATELDELLTYSDSTIAKWLPKICSGLPNGSPEPALSTHEFIVQVRNLVTDMAAEWEKNGKPGRS